MHSLGAILLALASFCLFVAWLNMDFCLHKLQIQIALIVTITIIVAKKFASGTMKSG